MHSLWPRNWIFGKHEKANWCIFFLFISSRRCLIWNTITFINGMIETSSFMNWYFPILLTDSNLNFHFIGMFKKISNIRKKSDIYWFTVKYILKYVWVRVGWDILYGFKYLWLIDWCNCWTFKVKHDNKYILSLFPRLFNFCVWIHSVLIL